MSSRKKWTKLEDAKLRKWYAADLDRLVAMLSPDRSRHAITQRAIRLGVNCRQFWTESEDSRIRSCYNQFGPAYCRQFMLHRTQRAIYDRAMQLGVRRDLKRRGTAAPNGDWLEAMELAFKKPWR